MAQLEDDSLKHAWSQVLAHDGQAIDPVSDLPYPHFASGAGLLYQVVKREEEVLEQLVIPRGFVSKVLYMAHSHLLGAHLGMDKTWERILARLYCPGVEQAVSEYCLACPDCQQTAPKPSTQNPLIPLSIIEVPFERLARDIVGPLPKTSRGHKHILVMVDYATLPQGPPPVGRHSQGSGPRVVSSVQSGRDSRGDINGSGVLFHVTHV